MADSRQSPIFVRQQELLRWLLQAARKFPRDQRHLMAQRLVGLAFALEDALLAASLDRAAVSAHLLAAERALAGLRRSLSLCHELAWLGPGQFQHASSLTAEVGRLLGGWRKSVA